MGMKVIKIGIIGSRVRDSMNDYIKVWHAFNKERIMYEHENYKVVIISGGAKKGGDRFAQHIHDEYGFEIKVYEPDFDQYGIPLAYFMRNDLIAQDSDILIACLGEGGGTSYTIDKFQKFHPKRKLIVL